ncbi:MAG: threonine/serine exporter family protein [Nocardioidaceae bacterium]|nr:threonine/serine exporter family protein [Nocardioidaceae bacterium]NUS50358.1 threonine/serine exporter family protein [Nocardioidaceae bacterium]
MAAPPAEVLDLLRHLGVALCRAGDAVNRVTLILDEVARAYRAEHVHFFVLPTAVFVRLGETGAVAVDFAPVSSRELRLDQVDALYRLVDDILAGPVEVSAARARLDALTISAPRFGAPTRVAATALLTVGLGLLLDPTPMALPAYLVLGCLVGVLQWWSGRDPVLALVLSVTAALTVTWVAFEVLSPLLGVPAAELVIPPLVTLLPGAALTMATVELSSGSMITGSSRLVFGLERLLLLSFGIAIGIEAAGLPPGRTGTETLGPWAPWLGVLVFGVGHFLASSGPRGTLPWLLLVLYPVYAVQALSGLALGSLGASFVAGAVVLPVAYAVQGLLHGPPAMVTFLPAFWLLVPGALGLAGVAEIVSVDAVSGLGDFLNALLSVVSIAVGVLVGAGVAERVGRTTPTWRGL